MKDYAKIFGTASSKPIITKMSLKALEVRLSAYRFIRIHKSYIVSADNVTVVEKGLVCIGNAELPLSESYHVNIDEILSR